MLLKYFHPLEEDSENISQRNIFWTTAEALFGSQQHLGGLNKQRAKPVIVEATRKVFNIAAWPCPCPDVLSGCADEIIEHFTGHASAPISFAIVTLRDRLQALKATKSSAQGNGHAAQSRAEGSKSAACSDGSCLTAFQKWIFLQLALLPVSRPSKVSNILDAATKDNSAIQQLFLEDEPSHAQQALFHLTMTDIRAIDTLGADPLPHRHPCQLRLAEDRASVPAVWRGTAAAC